MKPAPRPSLGVEDVDEQGFGALSAPFCEHVDDHGERVLVGDPGAVIAFADLEPTAGVDDADAVCDPIGDDGLLDVIEPPRWVAYLVLHLLAGVLGDRCVEMT